MERTVSGRTLTGRTATRRGLLAGAGLAGVAAGLAACTSDKGSGGGTGGATESPKPDPNAAAATIVTPAKDATGVSAATEIVYELKNATEATVELKDANGTVVTGELRADGSSWVPAKTLGYSMAYTLTVTATGSDGKTGTTTSGFTTMAKPSKTVRVTSFLGDNAKAGVGMPLMYKFSRAIPEAQRAEVQKRLFVSSEPVQDGIWHWFSGTEVHYRPKEYWQAGTKVNARLAIGGLDMGDGYYGKGDITLENLTIGSAVIMVADNKTKQMTVTKDGKVVKKIPISLGKPSTPSSSGTVVIIEKFVHTIFDTYAELGPELGYRTPIDYAQRLTWGGEYIHSAPWSISSQGKRNVSHGCLNMSPANAKWLFNLTSIGDPVTTKGTERQLKNGNGWTHWNMTWDEYVKGSAVPFVSAVTPTPAPSESESATPDPTASATATATPSA
ncbi:Ig-like domain-containing protein [Hamadaea sp. NPDC051192]|uniref:L,D-transpeptidase n=1 Tax=Hamadaea sp. NPDC051192 TaxID=3154940 RepID=UPI00343F2149